MEFKGTKENWKVTIVNQPHGNHTDRRRVLYSLDEFTKSLYSTEQHQANAKLIAAAPELLEALQSAKLELEFMHHQHNSDTTRVEIEKIEQAINKAL